ncbi:MAG: hypothetical protein F6K11_15670 [Leptolyngbya sp. SIO3F4]|nr:hypothetical protein [Leptolyngbya sp. SIO3F4]
MTDSLLFIVFGFFFLYPLWGLILLIAITLVWVMIYRRVRWRNARSKRILAKTIQQSIFVTVSVVMLTVYLVVLKAPLLFGFVVSRPFFIQYLHRLDTLPTTELTDADKQLADLRRLGKVGTVSINQQFGIYNVRTIGIDAQGGMYFVVDAEGLISTQTYYGIAYKPRKSNPVGQKDYSSRQLMGDWHEFKVTENKPWL